MSVSSERAARLSQSSREPKRRGDLYAAACPSRVILDHLTSRWGVLIVVALAERTHRFGELARRIGGVSEKMLAQSLRELEGDGFVARRVHPEIPPKVEYSLTPLGQEAAERLASLTDWIEKSLPRVMVARGRPLR